jgi:hypothetical protein
MLEPENVNDTWNLSLSATVVSFTEAVNSCATFICGNKTPKQNVTRKKKLT